MKQERVPEFVLETTFRYNHRTGDQFLLLLEQIAQTTYGN